MSRHVSVRIAALALLAALPAWPASAQEVGKASAVNPAATANQRTITIGASIAHKERIVTTAAGSVQILFVDKTSMTIGPNSDLTIDEYVYDPNAGSGKLAATLGKGALRFVGGQISHSGDAEIRTASAVIGIRGGVALIGPGHVFQGYGVATVTSQGSTVTLNANEYTQTPGAGQPPSPPAPPPPNFVANLIQGFQSNGGQTGGAAPGTASAANVSRAESQATGTNGGAVTGQLTPPVINQAPPVNNNPGNNLTQTIQTTTQNNAVQTAARPTITLSGFFAGLMQSWLTNNASSISTGTVSGSSATVALDGTSGRVQANFEGTVTRSPSDTGANHLPGSVAYKFDTVGSYYDYRNFAAAAAKDANGQARSTIDHLPIFDHSGGLVAFNDAVSSQNLCACDYTRWGLWTSESQQTVGGSTFTDKVPYGFWVAGQSINTSDVPTVGSASYDGHVIGSVQNGSSPLYLASGTLTTTVDFGARNGSARVSGFDGVTYNSSSLSLGSNDPRNISASLSGGDRTMTLNGQFFRGTSSPVGEIGGTAKVTGASYLASGIFAGRMK